MSSILLAVAAVIVVVVVVIAVDVVVGDVGSEKDPRSGYEGSKSAEKAEEQPKTRADVAQTTLAVREVAWGWRGGCRGGCYGGGLNSLNGGGRDCGVAVVVMMVGSKGE